MSFAGVVAGTVEEFPAAIGMPSEVGDNRRHETFDYNLPPLDESEGSGRKTICVTGATGFLGSHVVMRLLAAGHKVHGTCRAADDPSKTEYLRQLPGGENFTPFRAVLEEEGSFDEAVEGCEILIHTACQPSDICITAKNKQRDIVDRVVQGVENVMRSVIRGKDIKRVVLTSSACGLYSSPEERPLGSIINHDCWNERSCPTFQPFSCAKVFAEKAAWHHHDVQAYTDGEGGFTMAVIHPGMIMGPPVRGRLDSESIRFMALALSGSLRSIPDFRVGFVDVRDLAKGLCVAGLKVGVASGRYPAVHSTVRLWELFEPLVEQMIVPTRPGKSSFFSYVLHAPSRGMSRREVVEFWGKELLLDGGRFRHELKVEDMNDMPQSVIDMAKRMMVKDLVRTASEGCGSL
mmetsp:Transcript_20130/g.64046  ORF Transcript_20130/g.64046 Transcript_20130/m.64046 type:complete len:405 (+) Transcript_20130:90-1304(+)